MPHYIKIIISFSITCLLVGCQSFSFSGNQSDSNTIKAVSTPLETRSWVSKDCMLTGYNEREGGNSALSTVVAAVAAVLLPKLIDFIIDSTIEDLTEIKRLTSSSSTEFDLYVLNSEKSIYPQIREEFTCITTITAKFNQDAIDGSIAEILSKSEPKKELLDRVDLTGTNPSLEADIAKRLKNFGVGYTDLYSIYETKIEPSADNSAFNLTSQYLFIKKLLGNKNSAGVIYSYDLKGPGITPYASTYFSASVDFGKIDLGKNSKFRKIVLPNNFKKGKKTGLISRVGITPTSLSSFYTNVLSEIPNLTKTYMPVMLEVKNIQTVKPSQNALLAAKILGASKQIITSEVTGKLLPEDTRAAKIDAEISLKDAEIAYEAAKKDGDDLKIQSATFKFNRACQAYQALGGPCAVK